MVSPYNHRGAWTCPPLPVESLCSCCGWGYYLMEPGGWPDVSFESELQNEVPQPPCFPFNMGCSATQLGTVSSLDAARVCG